MKKILTIFFLMTFLVSCYDDYLKDFDFDGVYFPFQTNVRSVVVGEGMKIEIGVVLGGVRENSRDRIVNYQLDNSLVNEDILLAMKSGFEYVKSSLTNVTELNLLPANYYNLSDNSKFIISKGQHSGTIILQADSATFLSDPATLEAGYVLPLRITTADADTIIESRNYAVIGVKYENMLFGNYWHGGVTTVKDELGNVVQEIKYYTTIPSPDSRAWKLSTVAPSSLVTNGVSDLSSSSKQEFKITLEGGNITISSMPDATYEVLPDGPSSYNKAKLLQDRKIYLSYKYEHEGNWYYARDTLTFRNRIRDGVNEWQDENPENYN